MGEGHGRRATLVAMAALAVSAGPACALDPARSLDQLHHTAWRVEDGAPPDVWSLAQGADGYLWLGTGAGLYRFDGIRFEKVSPALGSDPSPSNITALLTMPDGDLWMGGFDGSVARLRSGRLEQVRAGLRRGAAVNLVIDGRGAVWAAFGGEPHQGGLARYDGLRWTPIGEGWGLPTATNASVAAASDGVLWATLDESLWYLRPGARRFVQVGVPVARNAQLGFTGGDGLLVSDTSGVRLLPRSALMERRAQPAALLGRRILAPRLRRLTVDRDGAIWGSPEPGGLLRARLDGRSLGGAPQLFRMRDGLSADLTLPVLEDREGDLWVGTNLGLDRFRAADVVRLPVVPVTSRAGYVGGVDASGRVIIKDAQAVYRVAPDLQTTVLARQSSAPLAVCAVRDATWVATVDDFLRVTGNVVTHVAGPPGWSAGPAGCVAEASGGLMASLADGRLYRWNGFWRPTPSPSPRPIGQLRWATADPNGGIWLCYRPGGLVHLAGDRLEHYEGLGGARLGQPDALIDDGRDILIGGERGLGRLRGRALQVIGPDQAPGLERITGLARTPDGEVWASGINGVVRISATELDHAFEDPAYRPRLQWLDSRDGLPGRAQQDTHQNTTFSAGGRVWFMTNHGVAWAEPRRFIRNPLPPPVIIRALLAGNRYASFPTQVTLPTGARSLEIDYAATSLAIPERVRFRYLLEGVDVAWVDPGARRQAFYTKLPPGSYTFRVVAANNSGVWNRQGATVRFTVPPRWFETRAFLAIAALLAAGVLWLLYMARLRQITARMRGLLEERVAERERIARELHDTLLQGFQALMLRFRAVATASPLGGPASGLLDEALHRAEEVLIEGRESVRDLRLAGRHAGLESSLADAAEASGDGSGVAFSLTVDGAPRLLHPLVAEECRRVGEEALANAFRHAQARNIEARVTYGARSLRLRVRDDGIGLAPERLVGANENHFGLTGMRERARRIQSGFLITSGAGTGVSVELTVPARVAYGVKRRAAEQRFGRVLHAEDAS